MALAVEWLPEEWPEGIPNLKQLLVVAPLTTSILLLFGCGNRNPRTVWPIFGRALARAHALWSAAALLPLFFSSAIAAVTQAFELEENSEQLLTFVGAIAFLVADL